MQISVVMTTYNGKAHLLDQLNSLRTQYRQPDEVLIFDDGSDDGTTEIVQQFIQQNGLQAWSFHQNGNRKGWKRNFMDGMRQASGDLIFPCDQDDIWHPEKIAEMEQAMALNPQILLLACDYHVVYEPGALPAKIYSKTRSERSGLIAQYGFTTHFFMNPYPGCSYAVRKSFFDAVEPLWFDGAPHDEFLWLMAALQNGAWFYNRVLMDYIRYADNASGIRYKDISLQQKNLRYIANSLQQLEYYAQVHPETVPAEHLSCVRTAQNWCAKRQVLMSTRNPLRWLAMAPWWGYYNSPKNCLSDLWLVLFGQFRRT